MKLISLKLLHYRRFRQEEIIFKDDFSLIFGKNGAGKSSILDAIGYTLFGPGSNDFVRVNKEYLRSYFLSDREPSKIELTFQYGLDTYKIVRIIDPGIKKFASDFITETKDTMNGPNGLEIIGGDVITDYVSSLIGVNRNVFLKSVFTKQKDLEVLSGPTVERKKLINSILGLDRIENIISIFKSEEKEKKITLEVYKKRVNDFDGDQLKIKKEEFSIQLKEVLERLKLEENSLKILNKTFTQTKEAFEVEDKKRQEFLSIGNQMSSNQKLIENLKNQNQNINLEIKKLFTKEMYLKENILIIEKEKTLREGLHQQEKNKILFIEIQKNKENLLKYEKDLKILNQNLEELVAFDLLKQIEIFEQEAKKLETEKEEITKIKTGFESKREIILGQYNELKQELENIKKLDSEADCPTCKRTLEGYLPKFIIFQEENINTKREEGKSIRNEIDKLTKKLDLIQKNLNQKRQYLEVLKQKEKEFIKISEQKVSLEKNISDINIKITDIGEIKFDEEKFLELKNLYEISKKEYLEYVKIEGEVRNKPKLEEDFLNNLSQTEKQTHELNTLNENLKKLKFDEEKYLKLKEIYFSLNIQIKIKNDEVNLCSKNKLEIDFELKNIEKQEANSKEDKKTIDNLVVEIDNLSLKKQIMSDYMIYLLNYMKPRIEDVASEYFSLITDYRYTIISLDEDYNIMIDGKNIDLFSGGERDLANLCLRLSLGQNLTSLKGNPINFLVLDEVLASQDKERQQNILINLKKLEKKFSQIILISHLEEIKDLATNLIEIKVLNREESIINYY